MKILQRVLPYGYYISIILVLLTCAWKVRSLLFPQHVSVICDNVIAHDVQSHIQEVVRTYVMQSVSASRVYTELKKEMPLLASLYISYKASLSAFVHIKAEFPRICIGESYILTDAAHIVEKRFFNSDVIASLPCIHLAHGASVHHFKNPHSGTSLLALAPSMFEHYTITWRSKNEVFLHSKKHTHLTLVADITSIHKKDKLLYAEHIYKRNEENYKKGIRIDIRLKDSLVCKPQGGDYYEKSIRV
jgi:hypothetical protein